MGDNFSGKALHDFLPDKVTLAELCFLFEFKFVHPDLREVRPWNRDEREWVSSATPHQSGWVVQYHTKDKTGFSPFGDLYLEMAHELYKAALYMKAVRTMSGEEVEYIDDDEAHRHHTPSATPRVESKVQACIKSTSGVEK